MDKISPAPFIVAQDRALARQHLQVSVWEYARKGISVKNGYLPIPLGIRRFGGED